MSDEYERLLDEEIAKAEAGCPVREERDEVENPVLCEMIEGGEHTCILFSGLCRACLKDDEEEFIVPKCCNGKRWCTSLDCR